MQNRKVVLFLICHSCSTGWCRHPPTSDAQTQAMAPVLPALGSLLTGSGWMTLGILPLVLATLTMLRYNEMDPESHPPNTKAVSKESKIDSYFKYQFKMSKKISRGLFCFLAVRQSSLLWACVVARSFRSIPPSDWGEDTPIRCRVNTAHDSASTRILK